MDPVMLLGFVAATLTTLAFAPQALKTWRAKSADDLSLGTFIMFCAGILLWLVYGFIRNDLPIIVANVVTFGLAFFILVLALKYRVRDRRRTSGEEP
ncbi:MAG: SemiSWEET transporter [Rhodothermales bacterium]